MVWQASLRLLRDLLRYERIDELHIRSQYSGQSGVIVPTEVHNKDPCPLRLPDVNSSSHGGCQKQ